MKLETSRKTRGRWFGARHKLNPLEHLGFNGSNGKLSKIYEKVMGEKLPDAHRAAGDVDVDGLVEVILADEKMRECVLKKQVGRTLNSWVARFDDLAERKEYVREMSAKAAARASYGTPVGPLGAEGGSPGD